MSQLTLPLSISLHLSVFLSRPYEVDGGPPEFGSARGFYPLGIFFSGRCCFVLVQGGSVGFPFGGAKPLVTPLNVI